MKQEVGFEEYLEYINEALLDYFLSFVQVLMGFLKSWVGTRREVGPRNVLIVGHLRSLLSMSFLSVHNMIPKNKILGAI